MSQCKNRVSQFVPTGFHYKEVFSNCGSTSRHGIKMLCEDCEKSEDRAYPQGWRHTPGDTCKHGTYLGAHEDNDERLCGACEGE